MLQGASELRLHTAMDLGMELNKTLDAAKFFPALYVHCENPQIPFPDPMFYY